MTDAQEIAGLRAMVETLEARLADVTADRDQLAAALFSQPPDPGPLGILDEDDCAEAR